MRCTSRDPHAEQTKRRDFAKRVKGSSARSAARRMGYATLTSLIQAKRAGGLKALALQIGDGRGRAHGVRPA